MTALPFRDGLGNVHRVGVRVGQDAASPAPLELERLLLGGMDMRGELALARARLRQLDAEHVAARDASHLIWAYNTPSPANSSEIYAAAWAAYEAGWAEVQRLEQVGGWGK